MFGIEVYLNGTKIGTTWQKEFTPTLLGSKTPKEEVQECISLACFCRKDDLLKIHNFDEFEVKGVIKNRKD